jgi:hypothetical protein
MIQQHASNDDPSSLKDLETTIETELNAALDEVLKRDFEFQRLLKLDQHHRELTEALGSPVLVRACWVPSKHAYVLKLKSGEELLFTKVTWHGNGWLTLEDAFSHAINPESFINGQVRSGLDVRLKDVSWVMDNPSGF